MSTRARARSALCPVLIAAAIDDRILQVDDACKQDGVLEPFSIFRIFGKPEKKAIGLGFIAFGDGPVHAGEALIDRAAFYWSMVLEIDFRWIPCGAVEAIDMCVRTRTLAIALFRIASIVAGKLADDLLPHVEPLRHVPQGLNARENAPGALQLAHQ